MRAFLSDRIMAYHEIPHSNKMSRLMVAMRLPAIDLFLQKTQSVMYVTHAADDRDSIYREALQWTQNTKGIVGKKPVHTE